MMDNDDRTLKKLFLKSGSGSGRFVGDFTMNNGIAHLVCRVSGAEDIVSGFCVPGYEMLRGDFAEYLDCLAQYIPDGCPVLLQITGCAMPDADRERIERAIRNRYTLKLSAALKERRGILLRSLWFALFALAALFGVLFSRRTDRTIAMELIYVVFYAFGDRMLQSFLLDRRDNHCTRLQLAQMKSLKLVFSDGYSDVLFTDEQAEEIRREIAERAASASRRR